MLDDAGIDRAVLVGAFNGGRVVLDTSVAAPQRVQAMALVGSALPGVSLDPEVEADFKAEGEALTAGDVARDGRSTCAGWSTASDGTRHGWIRRCARRSRAGSTSCSRARPRRWRRHRVTPRCSSPVRDRLTDVDVPTLVLVGRHDAPGMDVIARHLATELPQAHLIEIDGAAHLPNLEQPERFGKLLDGFLASLDA